MAVEYDLVIVGGTALARSIASLACRFQAQVALVEPQPPRSTDNFLMLLNHWAHRAHHAKWLPQPVLTDLSLTDLSHAQTDLFQTAAQTAPLLTESVMIQQQQSLDQLAAAGVDVVVGQGEFHRLPRMGFQVNGRSLRSRAYLLALPGFPEIPPIPGLDEVPFLTLETLADLKQEMLPERMMILGDDPQAIELAQGLQRLEVQVTLMQSQWLPQFDSQAGRLIQAQLEAEGVELFMGVRVDRIERAEQVERAERIEQVEQRDAGIRLQGQHALGNCTVEANSLLLATARRIDLAHLNLEAIGVKWHPGGVIVNRKLQTSHPRVYACGETLGGLSLPPLARYEADLVLHNVLFLPPRVAQPPFIPRTLLTDPPVAQVGMNEAAAKRIYGNTVQVLTVSTQTIARAYTEETEGFCTLILRRNGKILGGTIVSSQASEWISILTLALQQNLSIAQLARLPIPSPTFAELLVRLTQTWRHQQFTPQQRIWLDRYFDFRRSWHS